MFFILSEGLPVSRHETREEAESAMAKVRENALQIAADLIEESQENLSFARSLMIAEANQGRTSTPRA